MSAPPQDPTDTPSLERRGRRHGLRILRRAAAGPTSIATVGADGTVTPVSHDRPVADENALAYAEPFLAVPAAGHDPGDRRQDRRRAPRSRRDGRGRHGVRGAADGTLVFDTAALDGVSGPTGLYSWPPAAPTPTFLAAHVGQTAVAAAGPLIAFGSLTSPRVVGLGDGGARVVDTAGAELPRLIGFDGSRVAFSGSSCHGDSQIIVVGLDEPSPAGAVAGCPVRFTQPSARFGRSGRARVRVLCRNGCEAVASLRALSTSDVRAGRSVRARRSPTPRSGCAVPPARRR